MHFLCESETYLAMHLPGYSIRRRPRRCSDGYCDDGARCADASSAASGRAVCEVCGQDNRSIRVRGRCQDLPWSRARPGRRSDDRISSPIHTLLLSQVLWITCDTKLHSGHSRGRWTPFSSARDSPLRGRRDVRAAVDMTGTQQFTSWMPESYRVVRV